MSAQANSGFKHEIWQLINLDHSLIACGGFKKKNIFVWTEHSWKCEADITAPTEALLG